MGEARRQNNEVERDFNPDELAYYCGLLEQNERSQFETLIEARYFRPLPEARNHDASCFR